MSEHEYLSARDAAAMRSIAESSIACYTEPDTDLLLDWEDQLTPTVATKRPATAQDGQRGTRLSPNGPSANGGDE